MRNKDRPNGGSLKCITGNRREERLAMETRKTRVIDARGLQPPEPFERVVAALADLEDGESVLLILEREPLPLYRFLSANNYRWSTESHPDGRVEIRIEEL